MRTRNNIPYSENDFKRIPLRSKLDGSSLGLGDVAEITNGFADIDSSSEFDGEPTALVRVFRVGKQSAIEITFEFYCDSSWFWGRCETREPCT